MSHDFSCLEKLSVPVLVANGDGRVQFANQQFRTLCTPPGSDLDGPWLDLVHEQDRERAAQAWSQSHSRRAPFTCDLRVGDGLWVQARAEPPAATDPWVLSFAEISQFKILEAELLARDSLLEQIFGNRHAAIACLDSNFNFIRVNSAYAEADEKTVDFFPGRNHFELFPNEEGQKIFQQVLDTGEPYHAWARAFEYATAPERGVTWWDWSLWPLKDELSGEPQLLLVLVDVSRRVRAESELLQQRQLSDAVLEAANALMVVVDGDGRVQRFNRACEQLTGWGREEMLGQLVWDRLIPTDEIDKVRQGLSDLKDRKLPDELINDWMTHDGQRRTIEWHNAVLCDDQGDVEHVVSIGVDITRLRAIEASEEASRAQLATVFNALPDAVVFAGPNRRIVSINNSAEQIFGWSEEDLIGIETRRLYLHPEDFEQIGRKYFSSRAPGQGDVWEVEYRRRDGSAFWGETRGGKVWDASGRLLGFVAIIRDVSEEREVRQRMMIMQHALDKALDAFTMTDLDGRVSYVNEAFLKLWGYEHAEDVLGRIGTTLTADPRQAEETIQELRTRGHWIGEMEARRRDGREVAIRVAAHLYMGLDGRPLGIMASLVDISQQKSIEQELQRNEHILAEAQSIARVGSWDLNIRTKVLAWSDEIYRIFGLQPHEFPASYESFLSMIHPEDRQRVIEAVSASVADSKVPYDIMHRIIRPDGEERVVQEKGQVYWDESGEPVNMIGTVHDITETLRARETLSRFKDTLDMTLDCVFLFDPRTLKYLYVNQGAMDQVGYSEQELLRMHPYDIKPEFTEAQYRDLIEPLIRGEQQSRYFETLHRHRDGRDVPVEIFLQYINPPEQEPRFVAIVRDITERRRSQEQLSRYQEHLEELVVDRTRELEIAHKRLLRQERLATLGQLTATVSHELRNPLGAINSSLYLVKKKLGHGDERLSEALQRVDRNVSRCDRIIDELLDYTRITTLSREQLALGPWVRETLAEMDLPADVEQVLDLPGDGPCLSFDPSRLRRAVINVVENACQAMLEAGSVSRHVDGARLTVSLRQAPGRVELVIGDSGPGIHPEVLERIFEPLFSTKGFGVGLGMSAVRQIMEQHEGGVGISSGEGTGAEVSLWLPLVPGADPVRARSEEKTLDLQ